jgi:UDP-glucose 4-epimerase
MEETNVVVTGANGFLGRHVARCFAREGHRVLGIGHGEWPQEDWELWGLSGWRRADVTLHTLKQYARSPSAIVHCAGSGSVGFSIENPLADFERTVVTTAHMLEYVRLYAPSCRVVYPSSASVYGTVETIPIRENCPVAPISQYGVHKLMAEQMVASYARQFGISTSVVRLFSVYGCGLRKQLLWDACCKLAAGDPVFMGTGDEVRDWLHVEDAAKLLLVASEHANINCPTVNGGSGEGVIVRDILLHLGHSLSQQDVSPAFSGAQRAGDPSRYIADVTGARQWGWRPQHLWRDGVAEYATWWRQSNRPSPQEHALVQRNLLGLKKDWDER